MRTLTAVLLAGLLIAAQPAQAGDFSGHSVARQWNEALLDAIRNDFARPVVHARNLYHASVAMWDAWAAFDSRADGVLHLESMSAGSIEEARNEAISHAVHKLLQHRFALSPGNDTVDPDDPEKTSNKLEALMVSLGYDPDFNDPHEDSPRGLGIRIADTLIDYGLDDGANESNAYSNRFYQPINDPLNLDEPGNAAMIDPNRWQPLQRSEGFVDQSGNQVGDAQNFLGAEWGQVLPFALDESNLDIHPAGSGNEYWVYHDPGPPPMLTNDPGADSTVEYKANFVGVIEFSSMLDPSDGEEMDISPASMGNSTLGTNDGTGYSTNPYTGAPYEPQPVLRGDYYRAIAEFWADGPASETPPGHWFTLLNSVNDDPLLERRIGGEGDLVDPLEWDVKAYLALGGAMHDAAVSSWGIKGYHDAVRPIAAIRYMASRGQSTDLADPSYDPEGLPLVPGLIELITADSVNNHHAHLADHIGEIAIRAWRGHGHDPETETAGVGWIRAQAWWPYQQPDFVTPPFAGYVSGHSTFSRAAAQVLTRLTGDEFFPGGLGEYCVAQDSFLSFELGPSQDMCLQWARYYDAADESGRSRIYGGIHPEFDDLPGRVIGQTVGNDAWNLARRYFRGDIHLLFRDSFEVRE
ncbi:vanadium-dependent haloperoxidase [Wenzhouxiangella sp. XN201]|uniref:vanadium-dependent haloperoxidase n=1 Tax=Wenzhouxiangella sp. XN201 TaxID=2710755 RepID=UPI0013CDBB80|nr:vanadium-dependent haloperoxidase [Wenzhouxiangella sp. XN201]NEZ04096.1 vanadium-dependent haloperoxidase [Wenzhouxiangella sp. XN201]